MSREDVGDYSQVEADEDVDPDVLIAEDEERRRNARQRIEEMADESRD